MIHPDRLTPDSIRSLGRQALETVADDLRARVRVGLKKVARDPTLHWLLEKRYRQLRMVEQALEGKEG